jgi:ferrous iron transport protein A
MLPLYAEHVEFQEICMPANHDRITLSEMPPGEEAVLVNLQGGRNVNNRLASLGFTLGAQISMSQNYGHGPLIVIVRGARVALGRGEAARIIVERGLRERLS